MKLRTFNVVELIHEDVSITSFSDDVEGREQARDLFYKLATENRVYTLEFTPHITNGICLTVAGIVKSY